MARVGVVDIAYFRGVRGEIIVKELGVCTFTKHSLNFAAYTSCVFAPPYALSPQQQQLQQFDNIGDANRHGIAWDCGGIELSELGPILNRALAHVALVYCEGAETLSLVENLLEAKDCMVRDLNRLFVPDYSLLHYNSHAPAVCSVDHPVTGECALRKSYAYASWICGLYKSA